MSFNLKSLKLSKVVPIIIVLVFVIWILVNNLPRTIDHDTKKTTSAIGQASLNQQPLDKEAKMAEYSWGQKISNFILASFKLMLTPNKDGQINIDESQVVDQDIVTYTNDRYHPNIIRVFVGQEVTWINQDQDLFWPATDDHPIHTGYPNSNIAKCFKADHNDIFDACEPLDTQEKYSFVFNEIGTWPYHDHINPEATCTVIVIP